MEADSLLGEILGLGGGLEKILWIAASEIHRKKMQEGETFKKFFGSTL